METQKTTGKYSLYFAIWTGMILFMLASPGYRPFFWLALPGFCTYLAKGLDII